MQKKIESPSPKIQYSIMFQVPPKIRGGGGVETMQTLH